MISAASGMKARMESLEMLANNVANSATAGFKSDREFYSLYTSAQALEAQQDGLHPSAATLPVIEGRWTDFSQGTLTPTGNPLDLGLYGRGFFVVQSPSGPLYTRNGNFQISKDGALVTTEGYPVRRVPDGKAIQMDPSKPVEISKDGMVRQQGQEIAQIELADMDSPDSLSKLGSMYFQLSDPKLAAAPSRDLEVRQGTLENSNVPPAEAAVRLVSVLRQFEMLQRAMNMAGDMNRRALEEVARVS